MIQVSTTLAAVAAELFATILLAALVLGYLLASRKRVDRRAALAVAQDIKEGVPARLEALRQTLADGLGYSGEVLDEGARQLSHQERFLYQRLLNLYVKRDAAALRQITIDVENHTAACLGLLPEPAEGPTPAEGEVEALRQENEHLQEELRISMETMARMLDEYSHILSDEGGDMEMGGVEDAESAAVEGGELSDVEEAALAEEVEVSAPESVPQTAPEVAEPVPEPTPQLDPEVAEPEFVVQPAAPGDAEPIVQPDPAPAMVADPEAEELEDIWAEALAEQEQKEAEVAK